MTIPRPSWRTTLLATGSAAAGAACGYCLAKVGYRVDWPATGAMLQGLAAMLAAAAAAWGINKWQEELRFRRNSDLAEKVMVAVEGLVRNIEQTRFPPQFFEIDPRSPTGRVLSEFSYEFRLKKINDGEYVAELETLLNRVAAIFGMQHRAAISALCGMQSVVRFSLEESLRTVVALRLGQVGQDALGNVENLSTGLFPPKDGEDAYGNAISQNANKVRGLFKSSL